MKRSLFLSLKNVPIYSWLCLLSGPFILFSIPRSDRWASKQGVQGPTIYGMVRQSPDHRHFLEGTKMQLVEFTTPTGRRIIRYLYLGSAGKLRGYQVGDQVPLVYVASDPDNPVSLNTSNPLGVLPLALFILGLGLFALGVVGVLQAFYGDLTF